MMLTMNRFTASYVRSMIASTSSDQFVEGERKLPRGLSDEQLRLMEHESQNLDREFRLVEENFGSDHLDLVLAKGYVANLLTNARAVRHLAQHHSHILSEFQKMTEMRHAA